MFRLLKYDFKRLIRDTWPFWGILLLSAGLFDLLYWRLVNQSKIERYFSIIYIILAVVAVCAMYVCVVVWMVPVCTNLYTDLKTEGYRILAPATQNQYLASKVITGCVCMLLGTVVTVTTVFIISFPLSGAFEAKEAAESAEIVREAAGSSDSSNLISNLIGLLILLQLIRFVIQSYFSTVRGLTAAKKHPVAASVGIYCLISSAIILATALIASISAGLIGGDRAIVFMVLTLAAIHGILCVVLYLWSLKLLKNKMNLSDSETKSA